MLSNFFFFGGILWFFMFLLSGPPALFGLFLIFLGLMFDEDSVK